MSAAGIQAVVERIADDLLALAHAVMEDDRFGTNRKLGRNTLKNSALQGDLSATISQGLGEDPVIRALFNHYVVYLEWDRPPRYGKQPPIHVLKDWAAKKGIPTDAGTLWAISYAIWRDGHAGRPIFATMDEELDRLYEQDWAEALKNKMTEQLDNFFNTL